MFATRKCPNEIRGVDDCYVPFKLFNANARGALRTPRAHATTCDRIYIRTRGGQGWCPHHAGSGRLVTSIPTTQSPPHCSAILRHNPHLLLSPLWSGISTAYVTVGLRTDHDWGKRLGYVPYRGITEFTQSGPTFQNCLSGGVEYVAITL